jgi:hypothetical protein
MKHSAEYFEDKNPILVYIAKKLNESLRLEMVFDAGGIDYGVEADEYKGGVVFQTVRVGAFFYVLPESLHAAHEVMQRNGFKPYVEPELSGEKRAD